MQHTGIQTMELIGKIKHKPKVIEKNLPEHLAFALYIMLHCLIGAMHEPWFDEAAAWLIAKQSTLHEILFTATAYEGHPPLWHLVLAPFAKAGCPYALTLSAISLAFSGAAVWLIIYRSPFKRPIRILAPFTYFITYQYGIISRPYCMMMLAFALVAITYGKRNDHPGKHAASLLFLSLTHAYGLVFAGGIGLAWAINTVTSAIKKGKETKITINLVMRAFFNKGKLFWMIGLAAAALYIVMLILPSEDAYVILQDRKICDIDKTAWPVMAIYAALSTISDALITSGINTLGPIKLANIDIGQIWYSALAGMLILLIISVYARRRHMLSEFLIPWAVFSAVCTIGGYYSQNQGGIPLLYLGSFMWMAASKAVSDHKNAPEITAEAANRPCACDIQGVKTVQHGIKYLLLELTRYISLPFIYACIIVSMFWNVRACIKDMSWEYCYSKSVYGYLKDNGLESCTIESMILNSDRKVPEICSYTASSKILPALLSAARIAPYVDEGILLNARYGIYTRWAEMHKVPSREDYLQAANELLIANAEPEVIIADSTGYEGTFFQAANLGYIPGYTQVYETEYGLIYKGPAVKGTVRVYVRNDIAEEKGLAPKATLTIQEGQDVELSLDGKPLVKPNSDLQEYSIPLIQGSHRLTAAASNGGVKKSITFFYPYGAENIVVKIEKGSCYIDMEIEVTS